MISITEGSRPGEWKVLRTPTYEWSQWRHHIAKGPVVVVRGPWATTWIFSSVKVER